MADQTSTRDGRFCVSSVAWDHNGSHTVTVVDTGARAHDIEATAMAPTPRAARDLARRAVSRPDLVRSTHMYLVERAGIHVAYCFTVSRHERY